MKENIKFCVACGALGGELVGPPMLLGAFYPDLIAYGLYCSAPLVLATIIGLTYIRAQRINRIDITPVISDDYVSDRST